MSCPEQYQQVIAIPGPKKNSALSPYLLLSSRLERSKQFITMDEVGQGRKMQVPEFKSNLIIAREI